MIPLQALLSLIPGRAWLYTTIVALIIGGLGTFAIHERAAQHKKDVAVQVEATQKQAVKVKEVETHAKSEVQNDMEEYHKAVAAHPASDAPHIVCARPGKQLLADAGAGPVGPPKPAVPTAGTKDSGQFDPGPALDKLHQNADAQVKALQAYIKACQEAKICRT